MAKIEKKFQEYSAAKMKVAERKESERMNKHGLFDRLLGIFIKTKNR